MLMIIIMHMKKIILKYMMMIFVMVMYQDMIAVKSWTYLR